MTFVRIGGAKGGRVSGHGRCLVVVVVTESSRPSPPSPRTRRRALVAVVILSFLAAVWVAAPLWVAVLVGVVLAISMQRPYFALASALGARHASWAAAVVTIASGIAAGLVSAVVALTFTSEAMKVVTHLDAERTGSLGGLLGERGARAIAELGVDTDRLYRWIQGELSAAAAYAATLGAMLVRYTSFAILGLVVALMTMYYVLLDGPSLARRIERLAPLDPRHTRALLVEAREVGRTAFIGTIATAVVQGVIAGLGYAMFGVPQPVMWGLATALGSFLPIIGTAIVWVPLSGYLLVEGHPVRAVMLAAWGIVAVTSIADYWIRPKIVGSHGHGHPLLTLLALLGGIEVFGLAGLLVAPIVMSVFVAAFRIYEREVTGGPPAPARAEDEAEGPGHHLAAPLSEPS